MAYCLLQTDKCLQSALRRSGKAEIAAALAHLGAATPLSDDAIHDIRKSVKKLRALLQLVSPGFAHGRAEDGALRDMGRALAGTRDAAVRLATFDRVMAGDTAPDLAPLRAILLAQDTPAPSQDLAALAADFRALRERAARWKLHGKDHDILTKGLMKARLRACKAMHRAKAHPDQDRLHRWRRTVKTHWYHARLLAPVWPAALTPLAEAADILGESLGNHNDISML
ncbi:MAG: CHAD domain-containing protein, partial [Paracoccaceae bacterium]|nr:CHAD domain-containing protein [Paracoccaceae bacterium]